MGFFDFLMVDSKGKPKEKNTAKAGPKAPVARIPERRQDRRFISPIFKVQFGEETGETITWSMGGLEIRGLRKGYTVGQQLEGFLGRGDEADGDFTGEVVVVDRNAVRVRFLRVDPRLRNTMSRMISGGGQR